MHRPRPASVLMTVQAVALLATIATVPVQTSLERAVRPADDNPFAAVAPTGAAAFQAGQQPAGADGYVGDQTCLLCHDNRRAGYGDSVHGQTAHPRSPAALRGCESCHGPGAQHVEAPGTGPIEAFTTIDPVEGNETCLSCHRRDANALWDGSRHDARRLACTSCHSVHEFKSPSGQLKAASETQTCATCHRVQTMKIGRTVHMPVRERKMECSSCHNPHGTTNVKLLAVGNWVNESCVSCHTDRRGPFLFEHAAGRESCVTCHDPHGSSNDALLVAKMPMLCQRCHIGTRHPSTIYDAGAVRAGSNRIIGRSCVNCHQAIHGSNHPSGHSFLR